MAITESYLKELAREFKPGMESLLEAKALVKKSAFLCHSHRDKELVEYLIRALRVSGLDVYVDWKDTSLPSSPNEETAKKIQRKIKNADFFFFLATETSMKSRWCPWEIGYADGVLLNQNIVIIPIKKGSIEYGNEYLKLYKKIDASLSQGLAVFDVGRTIGSSLSNIR